MSANINLIKPGVFVKNAEISSLPYNTFMSNAYDNETAANAFARFLASEDGQMQQDILYENLVAFLPDPAARILDAACGQGWLSGKLKPQFPHVEGFDSSAPLIARAQKIYPGINFQIADLTTTIPYPDAAFDVVILNMAAHDLSDLSHAFSNLNRVLKPGGTLLMTMGNPYYAFPVGVWKRSLIGKLIRAMPRLLVRPYHHFARQKSQLQNWRQQLSSYFYPLQEYMKQALAAGFQLQVYRDLESPMDSNTFNVRYQLYRFPLILLLVFKKGGE